MAAKAASFAGFCYCGEKKLTPMGPLMRECECAKEYGPRGIKGELGHAVERVRWADSAVWAQSARIPFSFSFLFCISILNSNSNLKLNANKVQI
jgi:hypothetical protein